jgi:signal transduction histidine kinase
MIKSAKKAVLVGQEQEKPKPDSPQQANRIRLADFIHENIKPIVTEWEAFAKSLTPASNEMTPLALRNHIHQILAFIVSDIKSSQSNSEQVQKSHGKKQKASGATAAETHAALRLAGGFNIDQMVSEYRALRASVIKLWGRTNTQINKEDLIDLTRFNESIDQELAESVSHYTKKVNYSKDLFIGVLSHDIRSPLNAIMMSAQLQQNTATPKERQLMLSSQISESATRISTLVDDLLDVTRARFGAGIPAIRAPMDMEFVARQLVEEMRAVHPTRTILLKVSGDMKGQWDKARIGQVFSNLIGNAVQYSFKDTAIEVAVKGMKEEVELSVHNVGVPIPAEQTKTIFNSLTRAVTDEGDHPTSVNLGLGLFIVKEVVESHGGTIDVTSSEKEGTTFTARFPRAIDEAPDKALFDKQVME